MGNCVNCKRKCTGVVCSDLCLEQAMQYDEDLTKHGKDYADQEHYKKTRLDFTAHQPISNTKRA